MIFLRENLRDFDSWDIKILATDISHKALSEAIVGEYLEKDISVIPKALINRNFTQIDKGGKRLYAIDDALKSKITFRTFNLVNGDYSVFRFKFDIIFCRNVMIYFDSDTKRALISNFAKLLDRGSLLIIGDSETISEDKMEFKLIKSSIYKRI